MTVLRKSVGAAFLLALCMAAPAARAGFENPVDVPAVTSALASKSPLVAVTQAGARLVAVGQRGHVVFSDDQGQSWAQGSVPVSTDLMAVHFPSPQNGWAVGHGGVVIHSSDGGLTWTKQLDGKQASALILDYYAKADADGSLADAAEFARREQNLTGIGGTQPFMGVHFESDLRGYAVGTFNRILRTEDGGKTWVPLMHRIDNPNELHIFNVAAGPSGLYLVGEAGNVWKYEKDTDRFVARPVGYDGTLFGIVVADRALVAYGMRGSVYRSGDEGKSWQRVNVESQAGITGGSVVDGAAIVLVSVAGTTFRSADDGRSFTTVSLPRPMRYAGVVAAGAGGLALAGSEGVRVATLEAQRPHPTPSAGLPNRGTN